MKFRVMVTGSRDWNDPDTLQKMLDWVTIQHDPWDVTVVSGHCPTGADKMAEDLAVYRGWAVEEHPADWGRYGRAAGFRRNTEMAHSGIDLCVGFVLDKSKGTLHAIGEAIEAEVDTLVLHRASASTLRHAYAESRGFLPYDDDPENPSWPE